MKAKTIKTSLIIVLSFILTMSISKGFSQEIRKYEIGGNIFYIGISKDSITENYIIKYISNQLVIDSAVIKSDSIFYNANKLKVSSSIQYINLEQLNIISIFDSLRKYYKKSMYNSLKITDTIKNTKSTKRYNSLMITKDKVLKEEDLNKLLEIAYTLSKPKIKNTTHNIPFDLETQIGTVHLKKKTTVYTKTKNILLVDMPLLYNYINKISEEEFKMIFHKQKPNSLKLLEEQINLKIINRLLKETDVNKYLKKELVTFQKELKKFDRKNDKYYYKDKNSFKYDGNIVREIIQKVKADITKVDIVYEQGLIKYFNVTATFNEKTYLFNNTYALPTRSRKSINKLANERLYNRSLLNDSNISFIILDDFYRYDYNPTISSDDFSPKDTAISITDKISTPIPLMKETLRTAFDIRVYTDLTGLVGNQAAGIIQTEGLVHFKINTNWPRNCALKFFSFIEPSFYFSAFKDEYSGLLLNNSRDSSNSTNYIDALDLQRYSNFSTGINLNLLKFDLKVLSSNITINAFGNILSTTIKDSVIADIPNIYNNGILLGDSLTTNDYNITKHNAYSTTYGIELRWRALQSQYLGVDISAKFYGLALINSGDDYKLSNSSTIFKEVKTVSKEKLIFFYNPSITVFLKSSDKSNSSFFFRSSFQGCFGENAKSYLYVQLGYSIDINSAINNKK